MREPVTTIALSSPSADCCKHFLGARSGVLSRSVLVGCLFRSSGWRSSVLSESRSGDEGKTASGECLESRCSQQHPLSHDFETPRCKFPSPSSAKRQKFHTVSWGEKRDSYCDVTLMPHSDCEAPKNLNPNQWAHQFKGLQAVRRPSAASLRPTRSSGPRDSYRRSNRGLASAARATAQRSATARCLPG